MSAPIIAFFNNKGGVGKTALVYHLAWIYADLGLRVIAVDLDPQANLTSAFLEEDKLEEIWEEQDKTNTIFRCIKPLIDGTGDISSPQLEKIGDGLALIVGDLQLSGFEDELSSQWADCLDRKQKAFRIISAFWRIINNASQEFKSDIVLVDLGPNLGAINRAALISADYIVIPLSPDLFSLQGLKNLGPTVRRWREEWHERLNKNPKPDELKLPQGNMQAIGYVILQHEVRFDRPVKAFLKWIDKIPLTYTQAVQNEEHQLNIKPEEDLNRLALLKSYQSLMPMAQESRKPIFHLKPADGAIGSHANAVKEVYKDFKKLALKICDAIKIKV